MKTNLTKEQKETINKIVSKISTLKGSKFIGVNYISKTSGEVANHVVNTNCCYSNAVKKDLKILSNCKELDIQAITELGFHNELVTSAINKLKESFINNLSDDTRSNQSKAQTNNYYKINNALRYNLESGLLHINGLAISKQIIIKGEHKIVNSKELTKCQNAIKKHFNFSTIKYRNFIITPELLKHVKLNGETLTIE